MMKKLVPTLFAWIGVILTLAMAPTIETYNGHVTTNVTAAVNAAYMIGMTAIDDYGGLIMVITLLIGTGMFAFGSTKAQSFSVANLLSIIGTVVIAVFILAFYSGSAISYFDSLITAGTGVAKTVYGALATVTYVTIIGGVGGATAVAGYRKIKGKKKSSGSYI